MSTDVAGDNTVLSNLIVDKINNFRECAVDAVVSDERCGEWQSREQNLTSDTQCSGKPSRFSTVVVQDARTQN